MAASSSATLLSSRSPIKLTSLSSLTWRLPVCVSLPRHQRRRASPVFVVVSMDAKPTVLVAEKLGEAGLDLLKDFANVDCSYNLSPEELCTKISLCDALIVRSGTKVSREVFESSGGRLKVVGRAGVGIDNVDLGAATEQRNGICRFGVHGNNDEHRRRAASLVAREGDVVEQFIVFRQPWLRRRTPAVAPASPALKRMLLPSSSRFLYSFRWVVSSRTP